MVKQMFVSLFIVSLIVANGVIGIYLYSEFQEKESKANVCLDDMLVAVEEINTNKEEEPYIYTLTDQQIEQAIEEGKTGSNTEKYKLPVLEDHGGSTIVLKGAEIITPYYEIMIKSSYEFLKNNTNITVEKAKSTLDYENITFLVRTKDDVSWSYGAELIQGDEVIAPLDVQDSKPSSNTKTVKYKVRDINFSSEALFKVFDKVNESDYVIYKVDFSSYIQ